MPFLRRENGEQRGHCIELSDEEFLIGRAPDCNLVLDPQGVSRHHARIVSEGNALAIEDLGSRNFTRLNNQVLPPRHRRPLRQGDRINICDVEFTFLNRLTSGEDEPEITITEPVEDPPIQTLDASSTLRASGVPAEVKLEAILEISRNLASTLDLDEVAPRLLDTLLSLFPSAGRAFLILKDPRTGRLVRKAFKHRSQAKAALGGSPRDDEAQMSISRSIVNHVIDRKQAVLSQDAGNDADLPVSASVVDLKLRSVMCAPLLTPDDHVLGIIQLDTTSAREFRQEDLDLLLSVATQSAISLQNAQRYKELLDQERVKNDLKVAEQVQRRFLPRSLPEVPGFEFHSYYHAALNVGGDYYDFVPLPDDRLAIALADVSGKGISAALMMAKFSGDTRFCILDKQAPGPAANALNDLLCEADLEERFITLSLGLLDLNTGKLAITSAGHPPLLVRRADGTVEEWGNDTCGFPLGIIPEAAYLQSEYQLEAGDVVVVYSDGVTDARSPNDELYHSSEHPRLNRKLAELSGGPKAIGKALLQDIREFSAGQAQADDITLICFGRTKPKG